MEATTINIDQLLNIFVRWQFLVSCLSIYALVYYFKKAITIAKSVVAEAPWFKGYILTPLNLFTGALIGLFPGFIIEGDLLSRILVGIVAGLLSNFAYQLVKKRITGEEACAAVKDNISVAPAAETVPAPVVVKPGE